MKTRKLTAILAAAAVVAAAVWFAHWFRHRDERQIQRTIDVIASQLSKSGPEGEIVALAKTAQVANCFTEQPDIMAPPPINKPIQDLDMLRGAIHQARLSLERIGIRILRRDLEIDRERGTATMNVTAQVRVDYAGQQGDEVFRFALGWVRQEGRWRIDNVRTVEAPGDSMGFPSM